MRGAGNEVKVGESKAKERKEKGSTIEKLKRKLGGRDVGKGVRTCERQRQNLLTMRSMTLATCLHRPHFQSMREVW